MHRPLLFPLHIGKFVPPPYAGIEAHVDVLLRSLLSVSSPTLVATEPRQRTGQSIEPPYRLLRARSFGTFASVPLSPSILSIVRREFAEHRSNLLHLHAPNPWGDFALLLATPKDTPAIITWHSDIVRQRRLLKGYAVFQRLALRRADRIVVFTPKHYESSQQLKLPGLESKIVPIPIGIDFARLDNEPHHAALEDELTRWASGRPLIATVGRHVYYKGYQHLIAALAQTREPSVLAMVGTGPMSQALKNQARQLGIESRVCFLGEVDRTCLATVLRKCSFFCLPSIEPSEAFGIASAEAMALGKPTVVCTLGNGVDYLNRAGITSIATPPRDERALAAALDTLSADAALAASMGAAAKHWVRSEFGITTMRDQMLALYNSLI
jgi:glycosyltransferase involved in cell wall biosynthesis